MGGPKNRGGTLAKARARPWTRRRQPPPLADGPLVRARVDRRPRVRAPAVPLLRASPQRGARRLRASRERGARLLPVLPQRVGDRLLRVPRPPAAARPLHAPRSHAGARLLRVPVPRDAVQPPPAPRRAAARLLHAPARFAASGGAVRPPRAPDPTPALRREC